MPQMNDAPRVPHSSEPQSPMPQPPAPIGLRDKIRAIVPGLLIVLMVAMAAQFLSDHYGAPVMLMAILLGMPLQFLSEDARAQAEAVSAAPVPVDQLPLADAIALEPDAALLQGGDHAVIVTCIARQQIGKKFI